MTHGGWNYYYLWAVLLLACNVCAVGSTLFSLPGNWFIVLATAIFVWALGSTAALTWWLVGILAALAALGEVIEFFAGAAGVAKQGGSRRGMLLAIFGAMVGSILGTVSGVPVPVIGPVIGALGGGAFGAFVGAYVGEMWKGRAGEHRLAISQAALVGRLLGTIGKMTVGVVMLVIVTIATFFAGSPAV